MITKTAVQRQPRTDEPSDPIRITDYLRTFWRERRFILKAMLLGMIVAAIVSLIIRPTFESTTRLMPPEKGGSGLSLLAGVMDEKMASLASDALGVKTSGATFIGVMRSDTAEDRIIDKLKLLDVYRLKLRRDARARLEQNTQIAEDKKSGIISITVTDTSPQRAAAIAGEYVAQLNGLTTELNTSQAHRERVFLEERLAKVKVDIDVAAKRLSEFSTKNATLDPKEQGKAMFEAAAKLQTQLAAAEAELSGMQQIYTPNNIKVRLTEAKIGELRRQLRIMQGSVPSAPENRGLDMPAITQLPKLGVTYYDLYREVRVQEAVYEVLTKQYELAKVQEARELPSVKVLDEPQVPEKKVSPKRTSMTLTGMVLAGLFASLWLVMRETIARLDPTHPLKVLGWEVGQGISDDLTSARQRLGAKASGAAG